MVDQGKTEFRVDKLVKERFPTLSGAQIEEALLNRLVTDRAGRSLDKGSRQPSVEALDLSGLVAHLHRLKNPSVNFPVITVLHETDSWLVIDKPAGLAGHPLSLFDDNTVTHWAMAQYPSLREAFPDPQPTITPHRLDTDTSGLLIVAKTPESYALWRQCFRDKQVRKRYWAWCWGTPSQEEFEIRYQIAHARGERGTMVAIVGDVIFAPPVQNAESYVKVLGHWCNAKVPDGIFLAEVSCETGVTHQVRVHLAGRGHPLVGDLRYDPKFTSRQVTAPRHQLRAIRLSLNDWDVEASGDEFRAEILSQLP